MKIVVLALGGVITSVRTDHLPSDLEVEVIDFDNIESAAEADEAEKHALAACPFEAWPLAEPPPSC
jgi:hypothetical protein